MKAVGMGPAIHRHMNLKILLVDDDPSNLKHIARFLRGEGYEVDEACDGNEALQLLDEVGFDLVLSDVTMPAFDGFHLLERTLMIAPEVPFLLMSGFANIDLDQVAKRGATDFIVKPLDLDELLSKVKRALESTRH